MKTSILTLLALSVLPRAAQAADPASTCAKLQKDAEALICTAEITQAAAKQGAFEAIQKEKGERDPNYFLAREAAAAASYNASVCLDSFIEVCQKSLAE